MTNNTNGWELFTPGPEPAWRSPRPMVTIQRGGIISLNQAAMEALGGPEAIHLLFNRSSRMLGIRAADPDAPAAIRIRTASPSANSRGLSIISGGAFTRRYGIDTSAARRYEATLENGVLTVDLQSQAADASKIRGRHAQLAGSD